jgi:predicted nuclease with TOPRIM domain
MLTDVNAALQSIRVVSDWLKANKSLKNYNELESAMADVNVKLHAAYNQIDAARDKLESEKNRLAICQEECSSLNQKIMDLTKELDDLRKSRAKDEKYQLHRFNSGAFTYALKPEFTNDEPMHYLCASCYREGVHAILNSFFNGKRFVCERCKVNVQP